MKKRIMLMLSASHLLAIGIGFAAGIYLLPILIAPPSPDLTTVELAAKSGEYVGTFSRDREDSDPFHWGDGELSIGPESVSFIGELAPGPDYRLYLSPEFVETEDDFNRLKPNMVQVGDVKTFQNFVVPLGPDINPADYQAAIVWCESFGQFITSASYAPRAE